MVLASVLVAAVVGVVNAPPTKAVARMGLANPRSLALFLGGGSSGADLGRYADGQERFAEGTDVLGEAANELGDGTSVRTLRANVNVTASASADILVVTADGDTPRQAMRRADAVVTAYQSLTLRAANDAVNRALGAVSVARAQLNKELAGIRTNNAVDTAAVQAATAALGSLQQKAAQTQTEAALFGSGTTFIDPATAQPRPGKVARAARAGMLGALVGLLIAGAASWTWAGRRREVEDGAEAAQLLQAPLLGEIPTVDARRRAGLADPAHGALPGYYAVADALAATAGNGLYLVAGSGRRDGRTVTTIGLATALAAGGTRVAIVDGDLRTGQLTSRFPTEPGATGLAQLAAATTTLAAAIRTVPAAEGGELAVVGRGRAVGEPAGLLRRRALTDALDQLRDTFDVVLVDTPAAGATVDVFALATAATGMVAVVRRRTPARPLHRLRTQTAAADLPIVGVVITRMAKERSTYRALDDREPIVAETPRPADGFGTPTGPKAGAEQAPNRTVPAEAGLTEAEADTAATAATATPEAGPTAEAEPVGTGNGTGADTPAARPIATRH